VKRIVLISTIILIKSFALCSGNTPDLLLSNDEIRWLDETRHNIRFAPDPNWIPVDYVDSEGVHQGIVAELIKIIENKLDVSFNLVYFNAWADGLHGMRNNEVAVMGSVQRTEERERYLNFTDPYIIIPTVILVRKNYSDEINSKQINNMLLAGVRDYAYIEYVNKTYPGAEIIEYDDNLIALIQASLGNTDGVIIDLMSASALIEKYNITNLNIGTTLEYSLELRFASRKDLPELNSILQKTLAGIDEKQKQEIIGNWVNIQILGQGNFLSRNYKYFIYAAIFLLVSTLLILLISLSLKKQVYARTRELKNEVEQKNLALKRAAESDKLKTAFLNNLSHEIRTPMNGIVGFSTLLRDKKITREQIDQYTTIIDGSAYQLLNTVDDILEMAHIESNQVTIHTVHFDLKSLLDSIYDQYKYHVKEKNLEFILSIPENPIFGFYTDKTKLSLIISKLIDNSIKFTRKGKIEFGYKVSGEFLKFFVEDTGIGITYEMHERLFDRFFKIESTDSQFFGGSGLGLPISKGLVELLGGKIWFESTAERGSVFFFTIPMSENTEISGTDKKISQGEKQLFKEYDFSNITILIAEDDEFNQFYLQEIFTKTNAKIIMAVNGQEAVDSIISNPEISIALLDIKMPVMDGLKAARIIKGKYANLPLIAQTAYTQQHEKDAIFEAGFNEYISKPINQKELFRLIKTHIN
jgi:signal transduction histidine kinase